MDKKNNAVRLLDRSRRGDGIINNSISHKWTTASWK
jgi:hypothetical protein